MSVCGLALACQDSQSNDTGITLSLSAESGPGDGDGDGTGDGDGDTQGDGDGDGDGDTKFDFSQPDMPDNTGGGIPETCAEAEAGDSTVGCEFYALDMKLVQVYDPLQFAVAVSNVQAQQSANVSLQVWDGAMWIDAVPGVTLDALDLHVFEPPDRHLNATSLSPKFAYRVVSDVPIIAYQISPLEADGSFTSDASLLYPVTAWDTLHYVMGQERLNVAQTVYLDVIAAYDGTQVEVTPSVATSAGGGVPAGAAGVPMNLALDEGNVPQIIVTNPGDSLTGTRIESNEDHPVGVLTGNTCINIPIDTAACDHLQEQLAGVRLWGQDFVGARMPPRGGQGVTSEASLWQIIASEDSTMVDVTAAAGVTGIPGGPLVLDAGESTELFVTGEIDDPGNSSRAMSCLCRPFGSTTWPRSRA